MSLLYSNSNTQNKLLICVFNCVDENKNKQRIQDFYFAFCKYANL